MGDRKRGGGEKEALLYHVDWFSEHAAGWQAVLGGRGLEKKRGARALFVGCYEGQSVEWLLTNVMVGPGAEVVIVDDPTEGAKKGECVSFRGNDVWNPSAHDALRKNMALLSARSASTKKSTKVRIDIRVGPRSQADELRRMSARKSFDVVYIDTRSSMHAMESGVLAFPLLCPGGVMVFTNYTHGRMHDYVCPKRGIDGFLDAYAPAIRVLRPAFHLFLEKRATPLVHPVGCHAEIFDDGSAVKWNPNMDRKTCIGRGDGVEVKKSTKEWAQKK